jgi:hypothetical protein
MSLDWDAVRGASSPKIFIEDMRDVEQCKKHQVVLRWVDRGCEKSKEDAGCVKRNFCVSWTAEGILEENEPSGDLIDIP